MKIYTKTGDKGQTSLLGGKKVPKSNLRIEAYGNSDELNAFIGLLKDQEAVDQSVSDQLVWVQQKLFTIGSILATVPGFSGFSLPEIHEEDTRTLEKWMDEMDKELASLKNFILPGGHKTVSLCHVCRTVCRRVERSVSTLSETEQIDEKILPFLNRLSDYFFVLARKLAHDLNISETPWQAD